MVEQEDVYLQSSVVFKALARLTTIMGVDYDYFFIESLVVVLGFIYSNHFLLLSLFLPLHAAGVILHKLDPHIFRLLSVRASIGRVKLKALWRCQSYGEF